MRSARAVAKTGIVLLLGGALSAAVISCNRSSASVEEVRIESSAGLTALQQDLLDLAFETATAIPIHPHIKDRAKAQQEVVSACLDLGDPQRALAYADQIENWRRGMGYADVAFHYAQQGNEKDALRQLGAAERIAEETEDWRRDRIRVRIAQTHAWLGRTDLAAEYETGVEPAEEGKVDAIRAMRLDDATFDEQTADLDALIAAGHFDSTHNALKAYVEIFRTFYMNSERRAFAEERIKSSWGPMPVFVRFSLLLDLAEAALEHTDPHKAGALAEEAQAILDAHHWPLENRMPMAARLVMLRHRSGAVEQARSDADALLAVFEAEKETIVDIWRGGALRPLAEAYQAMGDASAARAVYHRAIEEGNRNPNSRPRAEDLAATICSMARSGAEPDSAIWDHLRQSREGLSEPW